MSVVSFFKVPRIELDDYRRWVGTLPCCGCGKEATDECRNDPHHRIGHGRCGNVKTDDLECLPLCRACHTALHAMGWAAWEAIHGLQSAFIVETLIQAYRQGVLTFDRKTARGISA
jgi:hypothetical protein